MVYRRRSAALRALPLHDEGGEARPRAARVGRVALRDPGSRHQVRLAIARVDGGALDARDARAARRRDRDARDDAPGDRLARSDLDSYDLVVALDDDVRDKVVSSLKLEMETPEEEMLYYHSRLILLSDFGTILMEDVPEDPAEAAASWELSSRKLLPPHLYERISPFLGQVSVRYFFPAFSFVLMRYLWFAPCPGPRPWGTGLDASASGPRRASLIYVAG